MIITQTEQALCARLQTGMGKMVRSINSYGGELDGDPAEVLRQLPAVWITFGGMQRTEVTSITQRRYRAHGRWVVIVGDRSVRNEKTARIGGAAVDEVGTYRLVYAVRRLLAGQDLALPIAHLVPGRVRTLFNTQLDQQALSVFACEFDTAWMEAALDNGAYASDDVINTPEHPDHVFSRYQATLSAPDPDWLRTRMSYEADTLTHEETLQHEQNSATTGNRSHGDG